MKPEEIELLFKSFSDSMQVEEASNGPIYVLLSVIVTVSPFVFRYFRKSFVLAIEKVMKVHVDKMEDLHTIMHMHIDELVHVKAAHEELKEKHIVLDKKVAVNKTIIESLKDQCA